MELNWDALRPGQRDAIDTIRSRVRGGERNTAIVLPTRYGKSDVARVAAMMLQEDGLVSCSLALSPNATLRDQFASASKWNDALRRYEMGPKKQPVISTVDRPKARPNANGEVFLSATMQLVERNVSLFAEWVESERHRTGLPVLVFVDECHTGSESNSWGKAVEKLVSWGAHAVLLTATAERSDGRRIPGFGFDVMGDEDVKVWQASPSQAPGYVHVKLFEGIKTKLRLKPDCQVRFQEAWTENALCKVSRTPFDVDLRDEDGSHISWLSELSPAKSKSELGRAVRRSEVVIEGCRRFAADLLRRQESQPDAAGMVYCGNDTDRDDPQVDQHARCIRKELLRIAPGFDVQIITSSSVDDGSDALQRFVGGRHDVVIVKQMAGMGLDVPRAKTGLDLSPTRTYASLVQRMMRPATPYQGILVSTWITPDDIQSKAIFKRIVSDEGGEASAAELEMILEYEKETEPRPAEPPLFATGTTVADFEDTAGNEAEGERWTTAEALMTAFPVLIGYYSYAEIVNRAQTIDATIVNEDANTVVDSGAVAEALRGDINQLANECTRTYMRLHALPYPEYGEVIKGVFGQAYDAASWPKGQKLDQLDDLHLLEAVREAMQAIRARLFREGGS